MYSSRIILYQFETSLDIFVELYQIVSEYLRQFSHVSKNKSQHVLKWYQITSECYNSFMTFTTCFRIVSNHIRVLTPAVFGQVSTCFRIVSNHIKVFQQFEDILGAL